MAPMAGVLCETRTVDSAHDVPEREELRHDLVLAPDLNDIGVILIKIVQTFFTLLAASNDPALAEHAGR